MSEPIQQSTVESARVKMPSFVEWRIILAFLLALSIFSVCLALHPQRASASAGTPIYTCGSTHGITRCYGVIYWKNGVNGAYTQITVRGMGGGDSFIQNEVWLVDSNPNEVEDCRVDPSQPRGKCWVEGGYKAFGSAYYGTDLPGTERWFWQDVRPGGGWHEHYSSPLQSGDYGHDVKVQLFRAGTDPLNQYWCPTAPNKDQWCIWILGNSSPLFKGISTVNSMYVDGYYEGLEMTGTSGEWANPASYTYNQWEAISNNSFNFQRNSGAPQPSQLPAKGYWSVHPENSSTGGTWLTCTQGTGC